MSIIFFSKSFNSLACGLFELHALKTKAIAIKNINFFKINPPILQM